MPLAPLIGHPRAVRDDLWRMNGHLILLAAVLTLIEAIGLLTDSSLITRGRDDWPQIYPYTVAGMAIIVLALALYRRGHPVTDWVARGLAIVTVVLGVGVDLLVSLEVLPSSDPTSSQVDWWVTFLPSAAITCITVATVLIRLGGDRVARVRFWMAVAGGAMSLLGLMSYLYESVALFTNLGVTGLSLPTSADRPGHRRSRDDGAARPASTRRAGREVRPLADAADPADAHRRAPPAGHGGVGDPAFRAGRPGRRSHVRPGDRRHPGRRHLGGRRRPEPSAARAHHRSDSGCGTRSSTRRAATAIVTVDGRIATANGAMARLVHATRSTSSSARWSRRPRLRPRSS